VKRDGEIALKSVSWKKGKDSEGCLGRKWRMWDQEKGGC